MVFHNLPSFLLLSSWLSAWLLMYPLKMFNLRNVTVIKSASCDATSLSPSFASRSRMSASSVTMLVSLSLTCLIAQCNNSRRFGYRTKRMIRLVHQVTSSSFQPGWPATGILSHCFIAIFTCIWWMLFLCRHFISCRPWLMELTGVNAQVVFKDQFRVL